MKKNDPVRFSSAVGEAWMHCMFKIKYCHKIFDDELHREAMRTLLLEAAYDYEIPVGELGFDSNHVHFLADIGMYRRDEVAKLLKGYTAKKFFEYFPELKRPRKEGGLFWDSGLWSPAYYMGAPRNLASTINYIKRQRYGDRPRQQQTLLAFGEGRSHTAVSLTGGAAFAT